MSASAELCSRKSKKYRPCSGSICKVTTSHQARPYSDAPCGPAAKTQFDGWLGRSLRAAAASRAPSEYAMRPKISRAASVPSRSIISARSVPTAEVLSSKPRWSWIQMRPSLGTKRKTCSRSSKLARSLLDRFQTASFCWLMNNSYVMRRNPSIAGNYVNVNIESWDIPTASSISHFIQVVMNK